MACDTCGKIGTRLTELREIYKTEKVADICPECEEVINRQLRKVQSVMADVQKGLMRRFIDTLRLKLGGRTSGGDHG